MTKTLKLICVVVSLVAALAIPALADSWTATFENGAGSDQSAIADTIAGMTFTTLTGGNMRYVDVTSGVYNATAGDGTIYESGEYFVGGNVAATVWNLSESGKINFTFGPASVFKIGYSSEYQFVVEAYDSTGIMIDSVTAPANTRSKGGTGLQYMQITHAQADIAYVVLHDHGGYWLVDDITTDAPASAPITPEPGSILLLGMGMVGLLAKVKARRS